MRLFPALQCAMLFSKRCLLTYLSGVHNARAEAFHEMGPGLFGFRGIFLYLFLKGNIYLSTFEFMPHFNIVNAYNSFSLQSGMNSGCPETLASARRNFTWWRRRSSRRAVCGIFKALQMPRARVLETLLDQKVIQLNLLFCHFSHYFILIIYLLIPLHSIYVLDFNGCLIKAWKIQWAIWRLSYVWILIAFASTIECARYIRIGNASKIHIHPLAPLIVRRRNTQRHRFRNLRQRRSLAFSTSLRLL